MIRLRIAVLGAMIAAVLGLSVPVASASPCNTEQLIATEYMPAGASVWQPLSPDVATVCITTGNGDVASTISVGLTSGFSDAGMPLFPAALPPGTRVRIRFTIPDAAPLPRFAEARAEEPEYSLDGRVVTVSGVVTSAVQMVMTNGDSVCPADITPKPEWSWTLWSRMSAPWGDDAPRYAGMIFASNAAAWGYPNFTPSGFYLSVRGCGDADPSTLEGFVSGFVPLEMVSHMGIPLDAVRAAPTEAIAGFMAIYKDDSALREVINPETGLPYINDATGKPVRALPAPMQLSMPFRLETRNGVEGLAFSLRLSYSAHNLDGRPNPGNLAAIRRCSQAGVPVTYSGSGATTVVSCKVKAPPSPRKLKWRFKGRRGSVAFTGVRGLRYSVTATKATANGPVVQAGTCRMSRRLAATCGVTVPQAGGWMLSVMPMRGKVEGAAPSRFFVVK